MFVNPSHTSTVPSTDIWSLHNAVRRVGNSHVYRIG